MEDRSHEIYEQYELKIYNTYKVRGAVVLETEDGLKICREFSGGEKHLQFEDEIKRQLKQSSYRNVDNFVRNREGNLVTTDAYGDKYVMRDWFYGEECSLKRKERAFGAVANLAWLHENLRGIQIVTELQQNESMPLFSEQFAKRNRELKRVRAYMRAKHRKNLFETQYEALWEMFYRQAGEAEELLARSDHDLLVAEAQAEGIICHGNYNYHNVLIIQEENAERTGVRAAEYLEAAEYATTNFEKAVYGPQVTDLYQFLRKALEKSDWDAEYGLALIEEYERLRPLRRCDMELLYILLLYPEKFWKITNCYYNSNKAWIPQKNIQKLTDLKMQAAGKETFLQRLLKQIQRRE